MGIAEQLGIFFPTVASAARAQKIKEVKERKELEAKKASQTKVVLELSAPKKGTSTSGDAVYRQLLWGGSGALFSVKIPSKAEYKVGVNGGNDYLHFYRPVKGGVVNLHVYHPKNSPASLLGETVICITQVWMKRYGDGREYIYLDLFVLPHETEFGRFPSHEWRVVQGRDPIMPKGMMNVYHFPTPEPLDGAIVIGEIPSKFK